MDNYHYIIAGLPELVLNADNGNLNYTALRDHIANSSAPKDVRLIEWLEFGLNEENLTHHFYRATFKSKSNFLKKFYALDLTIRNMKVDYISKKLGKESTSNKVELNNCIDIELSEEQIEKLTQIFANKNILEKEQMLDKFKWDYISDMIPYGSFNMDVILAFLAKGQLINRWNKLDRNTGKELFKKLVEEVRGTYQGIENKINE